MVRRAGHRVSGRPGRGRRPRRESDKRRLSPMAAGRSGIGPSRIAVPPVHRRRQSRCASRRGPGSASPTGDQMDQRWPGILPRLPPTAARRTGLCRPEPCLGSQPESCQSAARPGKRAWFGCYSCATDAACSMALSGRLGRMNSGRRSSARMRDLGNVAHWAFRRTAGAAWRKQPSYVGAAVPVSHGRRQDWFA
jgi:hypothetical protein